ncbi:hypothetical protein M9H77_28151 [Catharanthus roseus]|uniref:Uncharacterized protein n=1 Tax=Catharanthus roseus TaxID=4058 RepID=A0ACC0AH83_CATRO|nr:hypothetical protein M9H77_28151 [Catharanthus roseus]
MPQSGSAAARRSELFSPTSGIRALVPALWLQRPTATFGFEKFLRIWLFIQLAAEFLFTVYRLAADFIWFIFSLCFSKIKTQAWLESKRYQVSVSWREFLYLCITLFCNQNQT